MLLAFGSILVAMIFTQSFLNPLALLGFGIADLRARKFTIRLPETGEDELGSLVSGFNRMASGLQDIEGAGRVRAILYPPGPLEIPPFAFCGRSPANQTLGRQIFDFDRINEREVAFLVAICHTSGVTASLALALAKGSLSHPYTSPDPIQAIQDLEMTLRPILGEGFPLDLIYGRLDLRAGTIRMAGRHLTPPILFHEGKASSCVVQVPGQDLFDSGIQPFPHDGALLLLSGERPTGQTEPLLLKQSDRDLLAEFQLELAHRPIEEKVEALQAKLGEHAPDVAWTLLLVERADSKPGVSSV
jgi:hypothetical protein